MEEIKAQLGKDWAHCSDLSLKEISAISWRACEAEDRSNGIDGAPLTIPEANALIESGGYASYYEMAQAEFFQAKQQCINYEHLTDYIVDTFGDRVDPKKFLDHINNLTAPSELYQEGAVEASELSPP